MDILKTISDYISFFFSFYFKSFSLSFRKLLFVSVSRSLGALLSMYYAYDTLHQGTHWVNLVLKCKHWNCTLIITNNVNCNRIIEFIFNVCVCVSQAGSIESMLSLFSEAHARSDQLTLNRIRKKRTLNIFWQEEIFGLN